MQRGLLRACQRAGIELWSPYRLRHTYATEVAYEHGIETAMALLGHRTISTTLMYADRSVEQVLDVAATIG